MKKEYCIVIAVCLLLSSLNYAEPTKNRSIVIPKLQGDIKLDGKPDEPVWQQALTITPFLQNLASEPSRVKTEVKLWYDDKNLYIGWICEDPDIQATYKNHDATLWDEEVVECFITPKDRTVYYELQWNPLGTTFDALITNTLKPDGWSEKMKGDWKWTANGMKHAVFVDGTVGNSNDTDKGWQVEVIIPFSALGVATPKMNDTWFGNFFRYCRDKQKPDELLSANPTTKPSFHEPSRFMEIHFWNSSGMGGKSSY